MVHSHMANALSPMAAFATRAASCTSPTTNAWMLRTMFTCATSFGQSCCNTAASHLHHQPPIRFESKASHQLQQPKPPLTAALTPTTHLPPPPPLAAKLRQPHAKLHPPHQHTCTPSHSRVTTLGEMATASIMLQHRICSYCQSTTEQSWSKWYPVVSQTVHAAVP